MALLKQEESSKMLLKKKRIGNKGRKENIINYIELNDGNKMP